MKAVPFLATILFASGAILHSAEPAVFIELPFRFVIGGHANGKWLNTGAAGQKINPGMAFRLFTLEGEDGKIKVKKAAPEADVCMDVWMAEVEPETEKKGIAISAPWNPMPRPVKSAATTQDVYVKAVSEILIAQGLRKPVVKITQHLRVDLDADGEEEVLLAATHYPTSEGEGSAPMSAGAGNYSFTALRRVIGGKVVTQILEGEFYKKAEEFNAPNVHEIGGILDLDGDGKMEIILHSMYYEGGATMVWQLGEKKATRVLEIACGV
jgi:hypothetical protein